MGRLRLLSAVLLAGVANLASGGQPQSAELMAALHAGDHTRLDTLLRQGADPNARLADGSLPLTWAVDRQDPQAVRLLLRHRAAVNDRVPAGNVLRPLFAACLHPEPSILEQLLDAGADVRIRGPQQIPLLSVCAANAPLAIIDRLLRAGAPVTASDPNGQTALMWAAAHGRVDTFERLLTAGADPRRRTLGGFTATMFAVKSGSAAMARRALAASGDLQQTAADGTTLAQLAMYQRNFEFAADLIALGADLAAYDQNGRQLLHAAVEAEQPRLVAQLLNAGADPDAWTAASQIDWRYESNFRAGSYEFPAATPLLLAAAQGAPVLMRLLLESGADPQRVSDTGNHVVLAAAGSGNPEALRLALEHTPDVDRHDVHGQTPLHRVLASAEGEALAAMLRMLADRGARPDIADQRGRTPAAIAGDEHFRGRTIFTALFGPTATAAATVEP